MHIKAENVQKIKHFINISLAWGKPQAYYINTHCKKEQFRLSRNFKNATNA